MTFPARFACAALLAGLALPALAFDPSGEVQFVASGTLSGGAGAAYDAERVVGPMANLTRRDDGGWVGDLAGQNIDLEVSDRKLAGANVDIHLERSADKTTVRGLYFGKRISLELGPKTMSGRVGACSIDLERKAPGVFRGDVGCVDPRGGLMPQTAKATLKLTGDAASTYPPMPQFALALMAVLPG